MSLGRNSTDGVLWKLTPFPAVKFTTTGLRTQASPLFEEERDAVFETLIAYITDPLRIHRSGSWSAFTTDEHPVDPCKIKLSHGPNQRLDREKPHPSRSILYVAYSGLLAAVFDRDTKTHMKWFAVLAITSA